MTGSSKTNVYQAYGVFAGPDGISPGTIRITDWVSPPAVIDPTTELPVAGYSGIQQYKNQILYEVPGKNGVDWSLAGRPLGICLYGWIINI